MNEELTPLEIVKRWKAQIHWNKDFGWDKEIATVEKEVTDAEKNKKALEIIKEKRVDVCYFMNCRTLEEYNDDVLASYAYDQVDAEQRMLTQEEYNLLKEILE